MVYNSEMDACKIFMYENHGFDPNGSNPWCSYEFSTFPPRLQSLGGRV